MSTSNNFSPLIRWDYWDEVYGNEFKAFKDFGSKGEEWFYNDIKGIAKWLKKQCNNMHWFNLNTVRVLDVGCGNGLFLARLTREGFQDLTGFDYVKTAILLAKEACKNALESGFSDDDDSDDNDEYYRNSNEKDNTANVTIKFAAMDLTQPHQEYLNDNDFMDTLPDMNSNELQGNHQGTVTLIKNENLLNSKYDLIHDKGTFDIFFMKQEAHIYINSILKFFVKEGSIICVTSCNATETELIELFSTENTPLKFQYLDRLKHRNFTFGGITGNVVSTLLFKTLKN